MKCRSPYCLRSVQHRRFCAKCTLKMARSGETIPVLALSDDGELGEVSVISNRPDPWRRALVASVILTGILAGCLYLVSSAPTLASFN